MTTINAQEIIFEANNNAPSDKTSIKGDSGHMYLYSDGGWSFIESDNTNTVVSIAQSGAIEAASFQGSGTSLTNLNASNISSGTLNAVRISEDLYNNFGETHTSARTDFNDATAYNFGWRFVKGSTNGPGVNGAVQYYNLFVGLGTGYGKKYGMQIAYPRNVSNPYMCVRYRENNSWGGWQKISAGYADEAGTISGDLGLGTNSPAQKLHVEGNSYTSGIAYIGSTTRGLRGVTGDYGTVQTTGGGAGGWEGYSIDGRYVFMSKNDASCGIYNDMDSQWMINCLQNAGVKLYYNGATKVETTNTGISVTGEASFGSTTRQMLNLYNTDYGIGVQGSTQYFRTGTGGNFGWYSGGSHSNTTLDAGGGTAMMVLTATGLGLGITSPTEKLHVEGEGLFSGSITSQSTTTPSFLASTCTSTSFNFILGGKNDDGNNKLVVFVNGSARTADGGANTVTIRNDNGPIRFGRDSKLTTVTGSTVFVDTNLGLGTTSPGYKLDVSGTARVTGDITADSNMTLNGSGSKLVVMNAQDGGNKGVAMWQASNTDWGIYMSRPGTGKSFSGGNAVAGNGFSEWAIRFRLDGLNGTPANHGFIFESSAEQLLMSLRGSDGYMYVAGALTSGDIITSPRVQVDNGVIARGGLPTGTSDLGLYSQVYGDSMRFVTNNSRFSWYADSGSGTHTRMTLFENGTLNVVGTVTSNASDKRLKENIRMIEALPIIKKLHGYRFTWKKGIPNLEQSGEDMGLLAQDLVEAGMGDVCCTHAPFDMDTDGSSKSGEQYLTIHYHKLHALSIQAIHELSHAYDDICERLRLLEEKFLAINTI